MQSAPELILWIADQIVTYTGSMIGLNLFASAHIHPLTARALLVSLKGLSSAHW